MDPITLLALIKGATEFAKVLPGLVEGAKTALHPTDAATLDAALAQYRAENDAAFAATDAKLSAATAG